jgi:cobalt-zinc-cadmium efflux system membrane fusion protein
MINRILLLALVGVSGIAIGALVPGASDGLRSLAARMPLFDSLRKLEKTSSHSHSDERQAHQYSHEAEGRIRLSEERISAAKIQIGESAPGILSRPLAVPGTIVPDPSRLARIAAKVVGTVADLRKQLGDPVAQDEVVAVLESREVAEAKSEYISARVNLALQKTLFEREQALSQARVIAENQFLRTKNVFAEAELRAALTRQKLSALKVADEEIAALSAQTGDLRRYELRSPLAGRVVERLVDLGTPVGREGQASELYVIADLSSVWAELFVPTVDLAAVKEGQRVLISSGSHPTADARIVFISPLLNAETRSARVIASLPNPDFIWRPGTYVSARIVLDEQPVKLRLPRSALQTIGSEQVVFVRTPDGFEKRVVVIGKGDAESVEVVFGLEPGESVAITNTFVLKAELGKAEAEHVH